MLGVSGGSFIQVILAAAIRPLWHLGLIDANRDKARHQRPTNAATPSPSRFQATTSNACSSAKYTMEME